METFEEFVRVEIRFWDAVEAGLARGGQVSLATLQALRVIASVGEGARVNEVSRDLGITIGAASKLVDRLERDALAERTPNPSDRRSAIIVLTAPGEAARRGAEEVAQSVIDRILVDEADIRAVTDVVELLGARLQAAEVTA